MRSLVSLVRRKEPTGARSVRLPSGRTVGEIDGFITLLRSACEDAKVNETLQRLLSLPNEQRQSLVHCWVSDLIVSEAPRDFIEAVGCLLDDEVAETAYEVIFQCDRKSRE